MGVNNNGPMLFITILVFSLASISSALMEGGHRVGGWSPITDLTDPTVVEIGKFAVAEHNKQSKPALKFGKVVNGQSQVVAGTNYNLTIATGEEVGVKNYVAVVWDQPWKKMRKLVSFDGPV